MFASHETGEESGSMPGKFSPQAHRWAINLVLKLSSWSQFENSYLIHAAYSFRTRERWNGRELGTTGKSANGEDEATCDFAIRLNTLVEARKLTRFYYEVKHEMDGVSRYIQLSPTTAHIYALIIIYVILLILCYYGLQYKTLILHSAVAWNHAKVDCIN